MCGEQAKETRLPEGTSPPLSLPSALAICTQHPSAGLALVPALRSVSSVVLALLSFLLMAVSQDCNECRMCACAGMYVFYMYILCVHMCAWGVSESYLGGFTFFLTVFQRKRICVSTPVSFSMPRSEMAIVGIEVL